MNQSTPKNALFRHFARSDGALEQVFEVLNAIRFGVDRIAAAQEVKSGVGTVTDEQRMQTFHLVAAIEDRLLDAHAPVHPVDRLLPVLRSQLGQLRLPADVGLRALESGEIADRVAGCTALFALLFQNREELVTPLNLTDEVKKCLRAINRVEETLASHHVYALKDAKYLRDQLDKRRKEKAWYVEAKDAFKSLALETELDALLAPPTANEEKDFKLKLGKSIELRLQVLKRAGGERHTSNIAPALSADEHRTKGAAQ